MPNADQEPVTSLANHAFGRAPKGHVLIVDDDADVRALLALALEYGGYRVTAPAGAAEALAILEEADVDVVLSDLAMPRMDGFAFCERSRRARPDVPIVIVSGAGSLLTDAERRRIGAFEILDKPVELLTLRAVVARATAERHCLEARSSRGWPRLRAAGFAESSNEFSLASLLPQAPSP